jgi:hypothetical protein
LVISANTKATFVNRKHCGLSDTNQKRLDAGTTADCSVKNTVSNIHATYVSLNVRIILNHNFEDNNRISDYFE